MVFCGRLLIYLFPPQSLALPLFPLPVPLRGPLGAAPEPGWRRGKGDGRGARGLLLLLLFTKRAGANVPFFPRVNKVFKKGGFVRVPLQRAAPPPRGGGRRRALRPSHSREGWGWGEARGWFGAGIWAGLAPLSLALRPAACQWGEHSLGWGRASPWLLALLWGFQPPKGGRI